MAFITMGGTNAMGYILCHWSFTYHCIYYKLNCEKVGPGWAKKKDTQLKPNNFFVICLLPLQFTHITLQHVTFLYIEGFFLTQKKKKVMVNSSDTLLEGVSLELP
jgi:hypothetical protein